MPIDTEDKRASAAQSLLMSSLPVPDGSIGEPDRAQTAWLYSGIASGAVNVINIGAERVVHILLSGRNIFILDADRR